MPQRAQQRELPSDEVLRVAPKLEPKLVVSSLALRELRVLSVQPVSLFQSRDRRHRHRGPRCLVNLEPRRELALRREPLGPERAQARASAGR